MTWQKGLFSGHGRLYFINSAKGGIYSGLRLPESVKRPVEMRTSGFGTSVYAPDYRRGRSITFGWTDEWERSARLPAMSRLGFFAVWQWRSSWFPQRGVAVPWWFLTLVFAITPTRDAVRFAKTWRRRVGLCDACGYDLRATPDRCPECGRIRAA